MDKFDEIFQKFNHINESIDKLLQANALTELSTLMLQGLYDLSKEIEVTTNNSLPELIVNNFDEEQIWQEIDLQNNDNLLRYFKALENFAANKLILRFPYKLDSFEDRKIKKKLKNVKVFDGKSTEEDENSDNSEAENLVNSEGENLVESENEKNYSDSSSPDDKMRKYKLSVVDDQFFKLSEMENFLRLEEERESKGEFIKYNFFDSSDEEDAVVHNPNYSDFFDPIEDLKHQKVHVLEKQLIKYDVNDEYDLFDKNFEGKKDTNNESIKMKLITSHNDLEFKNELKHLKCNDKIQSSFEKKQEKLKKKISNLEDIAFKEKPWQLKGEIDAICRPVNSLLEEFVEFDMTQRPQPIITEETTSYLEDVIKRRIKDKAYDDVERKVKTINTLQELKKKIVLDQEKSKLSLAEIYEKEYMKQWDAKNHNTYERTEEESENCKKIKLRMKSLFKKLDTLSNFHFNPKPVIPEVKIITNINTIAMEEVAPVITTDANFLAPEELAGNCKHLLLGKDERNITDKKRERRKKKNYQAKIYKSKQNKNSNNNYSNQVKKLLQSRNVSTLQSNNTGIIKTSTDFFNQFQDDSVNLVKNNRKKQIL